VPMRRKRLLNSFNRNGLKMSPDGQTSLGSERRQCGVCTEKVSFW
jgi:hypothetical protein